MLFLIFTVRMDRRRLSETTVFHTPLQTPLPAGCRTWSAHCALNGKHFMTVLVEITERQMREAEERARKHVTENPVALSAVFIPEDGRLSIELSNGASFAIPARLIQGLEHASNEDLEEIEITASGTGLYFPAVDADILVLPLLAGVVGSRSFMARRMGKAGGASRSASKVEAARANGARGGRPRKVAVRSEEEGLVLAKK
jgi:hypothetical protein